MVSLPSTGYLNGEHCMVTLHSESDTQTSHLPNHHEILRKYSSLSPFWRLTNVCVISNRLLHFSFWAWSLPPWPWLWFQPIQPTAMAIQLPMPIQPIPATAMPIQLMQVTAMAIQHMQATAICSRSRTSIYLNPCRFNPTPTTNTSKKNQNCLPNTDLTREYSVRVK